ncbi:helix-turn-helix domain-containing protein [Streptomyces platensis]|uniref:helix-turn-helix domain-containing protein n=1 Tax=Streptomyces platensis TaxID=58346 RepID=UPI0037A76C18
MASRQTLHELPRLYSAAEVATALGCSEWWVKEQARRRRIPFIKSGSGYRFTKEHVQEIFNILEERPQGTSTQFPEAGAARRRVRTQAGTPVVQLRARPPRRARNVA